LRDQGKIVEMNDEKARQLFEILIKRTSQAGLQQYEISNFALPGYASLHNSSYWKGIPYLGLGASAHSYNGDTRQWNVSHLKKYIEGVNQASNYYEIEHLSPDDSYNEYVMTGLRTESGISLKFIRETFGEERLSYLLKNAQISLDNELLVRNDSVLKLTKSGIYVSDSVMSDLMYI
jgi:oxygen-independent coproporphyrinogen-3 oxidase